MIDYRCFRNSDPPALARLWNSQRDSSPRLPTATPRLLDEYPLAKPYFDPQGLWIAEDSGRVIGFAHAGAGPRADGSGLDPTAGVVSQLIVEAHPRQVEVAHELLSRCESYLKERGAQSVSAGPLSPVDPFYFGLCGGARCAGVPAKATEVCDWFVRAGYVEETRTSIQQRTLTGFRPPVDRQQMQWRRTASLDVQSELAPANWWEACTYGQRDRVRLVVRATSTAGPRSGYATLWDMQPLASEWGIRAAGLLDYSWDDSAWRDGLAVFVLAESMRILVETSVGVVELAVPVGDSRWPPLLNALGFREIDISVTLSKNLSA